MVAVALVELPTLVPAKPGRPAIGGPNHPMRQVTREIAFAAEGWTRDRAAKVAELFDGLAPTWRERDIPERHDALRDALTRGGPFPSGVCLEIGAGTGSATPDLVATLGRVVATDLSAGMLSLAAPAVPLVRADAAQLPVRDHALVTVALVNMFLFPREVDRVVALDGAVLWVSTNGEDTPIYLDPAEVVGCLPGAWDGVTARAGWGTWVVARRSR
jgi:SAM-dependent methyltransferase